MKLLTTAVLMVLIATASAKADEPPVNGDASTTVDEATMQRVYQTLQTPHKVGRILTPAEGEYYDCPNVYRHNGRWWMVFVSIKELVGYETRLAVSDDLVDWEIVGTPLGFQEAGWDMWQADGSIALVDPEWGGSYELGKHDGKYWMSYFGGAKQGYETDPLSIGMAWTDDPTQPGEWNRLAENPVMQPSDVDARPFEDKTLYKSHILRDPAETLGAPFVMFYNGKQSGAWVERIGIAVSDDMKSWRRYGDGPVVDNGKGITGDPQLIRMDDLWVMPYFGAGWKPRAFDTFAVSRDMRHWTKWEGEHLIAPSEPFDETFAHKPWILKHDGVVYHFYCSVGEGVRAIALATSEEIPAPQGTPNDEQ